MCIMLGDSAGDPNACARDKAGTSVCERYARFPVVLADDRPSRTGDLRLPAAGAGVFFFFFAIV